MNAVLSVSKIEPLTIAKPPALHDFYTLSPFVWRDGGKYSMLLRVVNPSPDASKKVARIHYASSDDGLRFELSANACIVPGPGEDDRDGCEDPTLVSIDGMWHVYYTGWNQQLNRGELLYACGTNESHLVKRGVALESKPPSKNPKEATLVQGADGIWNLFFEYANGGASQIGLAKATGVAGPWTIVKAPFFQQRADSWDMWHLSPGPICKVAGEQVMFYNGGSKDPKWRIGWVAFDSNFEHVTARSQDPLIVPPPPSGDATDIAFSASVVEASDARWLYYSVADKDLCRATVLTSSSGNRVV